MHGQRRGPCDDGDACTIGGHLCALGVCVGGSAPPNCDDGNVCTDDSCDPVIGCQSVNNYAPCNDGDGCTTDDTCLGGACVGGAALDCDDGSVCTDDSCNPASGCVNVNNTDPCDDGNACTADDACLNGICTGGPPLNCDDGNPCTDDSCHAVLGCQHTDNCPASFVCNSGTGTCDLVCAFQEGYNAYTGTVDTFIQEASPDSINGDMEGWEWDLSDGSPAGSNFGLIRFDNIFGTNPGQIPPTAQMTSARLTYTIGGPQDATGEPARVHEINVVWDESVSYNTFGGDPGAAIGDEYDPTIIDTALADTLYAHTVDVTSSLQAWLQDPPSNKGWIFVPVGPTGNGAEVRASEYQTIPSERPMLTVTLTPCGDNSECDDGNICTDDVCAAGVCQYTYNAAACDDGNACTTADACANGVCVGGSPPNCDDGNVCTDDSAAIRAPAVSEHEQRRRAASDGDACTTSGHLLGCRVVCVGGAPPNCDDGNVCTDDSLAIRASGCVNTSTTRRACDDWRCRAPPRMTCMRGR